MGGYGSGRTSKVGRKPRKKAFVGELPSLNSFKVMPGRIAATGGYSRISLGRFKGTVTTEELDIFDGDNLIVSSPMQPSSVGYGTRYYFTCPSCRGRVAKLYLKQTFACRGCHNLAYLSQNISNEDRWLLKRERLLKRYGLSFGQASYCEKKKWMHNKTFDRVVLEFNFLNDMGINIHLDRYDYKRVLRLWRSGRRDLDYPCDYSKTVISQLKPSGAPTLKPTLSGILMDEFCGVLIKGLEGSKTKHKIAGEAGPLWCDTPSFSFDFF